ncbi:MAG: ral secretory system protein domain protein [Deltaproteobacteria bacterium]|nr:ral secretory system protein domain protein [Deltaproteobacteria bacterium]
MADDAGALLVRSGLVPSSALNDARVGVANHGGTLGEQLVIAGVIADDALTDFYRSRLMVPLVNPNALARLPVRVVATIPSDMAIELRAIPVSLDADNNLTVAMSDPSDSHAVDEIAFFTGTYVVRAVATQMQIAWCLAHYYGHVTILGQRLLQPSGGFDPPPALDPAPASSSSLPTTPIPRVKGLTGQVAAMRHKAIAPTTGPHGQLASRPTSGEIELTPMAAGDAAAPPSAASAPESEPEHAPERTTEEAPDLPRARSVSGEIRAPIRRAPSIRPPMPELDDESGPVITVEVAPNDEAPAGLRRVPARRRVKTDPPELAARAGEVDISTGPVHRIDLDEPRIIIADEAPARPITGADVTGELDIVAHRDEAGAPATTIEVSDDTSISVVIHEHYHHESGAESAPVLLDRRRPIDDRATVAVATARPGPQDPDAHDVVELDKPRYHRTEKRTQIGIGALPALTRAQRDTEAGGIPTEVVDDAPTAASQGPDETRLDAHPAPPRVDDFTDETLAAPPSAEDRTISPPAPPPAVTSSSGAHGSTAEPTSHDEDGNSFTAVMSTYELDDAIPERRPESLPAHLEHVRTQDTSATRSIDYDSLDEGWGPPGTTIPPELLGAIPGSLDPDSARIPMSNVDSAPLVVAPPTPPETPPTGSGLDGSGAILVRALEEATSRSLELIHALERTETRDAVITLMSAHLAESHRVSGFFSIRGGDLALFSIKPQPEVPSVTTLRLDRPSTLQDVVGTRLPYRGPMHDDASRNFLASVLGSCPPEILLVPIAVRERVVGVLFGEQRLRHTFDDQLAFAARAAGIALERILKAKRG